MVIEDESNRDLIVVGGGMLAGLLVAVAINILSNAYSGFKVVTPESMSLVEPVSLIYVLGIFLGIYWFLMESWKNFGRFGTVISFIAGFLITMGLSMLGAVL
jgi:hypothetical protein